MAKTVKASTILSAEKLPAKVVLQANPREFREQLGGTILPNSITLDTFVQNIMYPKYSWSYLGVSSWVAITGQTSSSLTITSGEWNARYYRVEVIGYTTSGQTIRSNQDGYDIMLIQKLPYDAALAAELDIIKSTTDKIPVSIQGSLLMGSKLFLRNPGDKNETGQENAGVNGSDVPLTNPAFWAGGAYTEAVTGEAKAIIRHDGSGQLAGGNILWDESGDTLIKGTIRNSESLTQFVQLGSGGGYPQITMLQSGVGLLIGTEESDRTTPIIKIEKLSNSELWSILQASNFRVNSENGQSAILGGGISVLKKSSSTKFTVGVDKSDSILRVVFVGLPTSPTGLSTGQLYKDTNGFLKVV